MRVRVRVRQGRTEAGGRAHDSVLKGDLVGLLDGGAVGHGCQKDKAAQIRMKKRTLVQVRQIQQHCPEQWTVDRDTGKVSLKKGVGFVRGDGGMVSCTHDQ